ncbi:MAG TPA: S8 family peptidase [Azoarcus taiwanensis]|nr:S8 family peptidase [Azoarcus taiwanensis]
MPFFRLLQHCVPLILALSVSFPLLADSGVSGRVLFQLDPVVSAADKRVSSMDRAHTLGASLNIALDVATGPAPDMIIVSAEGMSAEALAEQLQAQPGVVFASPDRRKQIRTVPNDPLFDSQWALRNIEAAAIAAVDAWPSTTGSSEVVIAVLDTGVRFEHEDLVDRLLPGYDFISDPRSAGDGTGRDTDASDEGDFLTAQDLQDSFFFGCGDGPQGNLPTTSSWHGTRVSGIVAATGNNSRGIAGVSWAARLLPVRALGKCGGFDSDIIPAMRWAGGLPVPGVPDNPHPARIINMSLGGPGQCSAAYASTVAELRAAGVLVIAAAGNGVEMVEEPGNCPGVFTVGGLRHTGSKVGFSSFGPEVDIAAPAGNCVNTGFGEPCLFQIGTTINLGSTTPTTDGYSTTQNPTIGTSFAAPLASGVAALMLSLHPQLQPEALADRMRASARPFPTEPGLPFCPEFVMASGQCNCTTGSCGAGMLDAGGAVALARAPQALAEAGRDLTGQWLLDAGRSTASAGRRVVAWQWAHVDGPTVAQFTNPAGVTTPMIAVLPGQYTVSLTVTDDLGGRDSVLFRVETSEFVSPPEVQPPPQPEPGEGVKRSRGGGGGAMETLTLLALLALAVASAYLPRRVAPVRKSSAKRLPPA